MEPLPLGQFLLSQIIEGAVLTCSLVSVTSVVTCVDPRLNGLLIRFGLGEINAICTRVTGHGYALANGFGDSSPPYAWNGSAWGPGPPTHNGFLTKLNCIG